MCLVAIFPCVDLILWLNECVWDLVTNITCCNAERMQLDASELLHLHMNFQAVVFQYDKSN